ncbi:MAG: hypothetical protein HZA31_11975 [Opitutae bacterium]|nr:hypothetical protein [Opitutae bacterium]
MCSVLLGLLTAPVLALAAPAGTSSRFVDHGVATPISNHRGTVATVDAAGRNIVLLWLMDHRGGYALLLIDAATGKTEQFPVPLPIPGESVDCPYASLLSSQNKFYTLFGSHFVEFDVAQRAFTFHHATTPRFAMGMTEDDQGAIWAVNYPQCGVVSFNPKTKAFRDYSEVRTENWQQYPKSAATDDAGWFYFGLGNTASQIVALDPVSGKAQALLPEAARQKGQAHVYRDLNGKVYGQALRGPKEEWYELYRGEIRKVGTSHEPQRKPIITGDQSLFHATFPDGTKLKSCNLVDRMVQFVATDGKVTELPIEYTSDGAVAMSVAMAPDGTLCGGTAFPMRFFSYNPDKDSWVRRPAYHQWNTVVRQGDHFFVGGYPAGFLLDWDTTQPWINTEKNRAGCNPLYVTDCTPDLYRPYRIFAHPDGRTIIMGGTPNYGYTGGGLLLWDSATKTRVLLTHEQILLNQSSMCFAALPDGKLLVGTTTAAGTGGEKKAAEAELYIMDLATKKLDWHQAVIPGTQEYTDICQGPNGTIYGIADAKTFFVFDPVARKILRQEDASARFGLTVARQGAQVFVPGEKGALYLLFNKGVVELAAGKETLTMLQEVPQKVDAGGQYYKGRVYFVSGSHLCSVSVAP